MIASKIPSNQLQKGKTKPMNVMWGAWLKEATYDQDSREYTFKGIYDVIFKRNKDDYPFTTDLLIVLALQSFPIESGKSYDLQLAIQDLDGSILFSLDDKIQMPETDNSQERWYISYELNDAVIEQPGYYELNVIINQESRHQIPLWVISPKVVDLTKLLEEDIYEERWWEDFDKGQ